MKIAFPKFPKKTVRFAAAASVLLATAVSSVKIIRTNEFGLQETTGVVTSGVMLPGVYFQVPFAQITHAYRGNTQTISFGAGSFRFFPWNHDTADKNILVADVTINY